ncbi:hypothetical protein DFJ73DRAFT_960299 [Zopfochytrium polystomum]|nr:hypothetical protein DFJ73DRAFT_960299 [Zopfochytrium polystomum]
MSVEGGTESQQQQQQQQHDLGVALTPAQAIELNRLGQEVKMAFAVLAMKQVESAMSDDPSAPPTDNATAGATKALADAKTQFEAFLLGCGIAKDSDAFNGAFLAAAGDPGASNYGGGRGGARPSEPDFKHADNANNLKQQQQRQKDLKALFSNAEPVPQPQWSPQPQQTPVVERPPDPAPQPAPPPPEELPLPVAQAKVTTTRAEDRRKKLPPIVRPPTVRDEAARTVVPQVFNSGLKEIEPVARHDAGGGGGATVAWNNRSNRRRMPPPQAKPAPAALKKQQKEPAPRPSLHVLDMSPATFSFPPSKKMNEKM